MKRFYDIIERNYDFVNQTVIINNFVRNFYSLVSKVRNDFIKISKPFVFLAY